MKLVALVVVFDVVVLIGIITLALFKPLIAVSYITVILFLTFALICWRMLNNKNHEH